MLIVSPLTARVLKAEKSAAQLLFVEVPVFAITLDSEGILNSRRALRSWPRADATAPAIQHGKPLIENDNEPTARAGSVNGIGIYIPGALPLSMSSGFSLILKINTEPRLLIVKKKYTKGLFSPP